MTMGMRGQNSKKRNFKPGEINTFKGETKINLVSKGFMCISDEHYGFHFNTCSSSYMQSMLHFDLKVYATVLYLSAEKSKWKVTITKTECTKGNYSLSHVIHIM